MSARTDPREDYSSPYSFYDYIKPKMVEVGMLQQIK